MTDSFGARLRRQREFQKIGLADIADRTKIKASLFEALERDDASQWPAGLFRRSFMRAYAEAIGVDAEATLREFLELFPDPSDGPAERPTGQPQQPLEPEVAPGLRLTLVETGIPFRGGRYLADARRRWAACVWDIGVLFAVALSLYVIVNEFWMPFGVIALCYYLGSILTLGNTPGVWLFAPQPLDDPAYSPPLPRPARHRYTEPGRVRHAESPRNPFRSIRRPRVTRT
jgi:transcriptional regulator with XRE-family HTH domain